MAALNGVDTADFETGCQGHFAQTGIGVSMCMGSLQAGTSVPHVYAVVLLNTATLGCVVLCCAVGVVFGAVLLHVHLGARIGAL